MYFVYDNVGIYKGGIEIDPLYVALTRASKQLVLIHDSHHGFLPFVKRDEIQQLCDFFDTDKKPYSSVHNKKRNENDDDEKEEKEEDETDELGNELKRHYWVTELLKHMTLQDYLPICEKYFETKVVRKPFYCIELDETQSTSNNKYHEDLISLNGIIIPSLYQFSKDKQCSILSMLLRRIQDHENNPHRERHVSPGQIERFQNVKSLLLAEQKRFVTKMCNCFRQALNRKHIDHLDIKDIIVCCVAYECFMTGNSIPLKQMERFDWIPMQVQEGFGILF